MRQALARGRQETLGHPDGLHPGSLLARRLIDEATQRIAALVGGAAGDVVHTSGGTEANRLGLRALLGGRVVVGATEHDAVLAPLRAWAAEGRCEVDVLPVDADGRHDLDALRAKLPGATGLALMAANHETGVLTDLASVADLVADAGVPWHCDAVQAAGKLPLDVGALPVQSVALASHKLGGPPGVGAVLTRVPVSRPGTLDAVAVSAFGLAATSATEGDRGLRDALEAALPGHVCGAGAPRLWNTSFVVFDGRDGRELVEDLAFRGVAAGTGAACATGRPSRVLMAMGYDAEAASSAVRFSLGPSTTREQVATAAEAMRQILG